MIGYDNESKLFRGSTMAKMLDRFRNSTPTCPMERQATTFRNTQTGFWWQQDCQKEDTFMLYQGDTKDETSLPLSPDQTMKKLQDMQERSVLHATQKTQTMETLQELQMRSVYYARR